MRSFLYLMMAVLLTHQGQAFARAKSSKPKAPSEVHCLAKNIYHEARGQSYQGMLAVAQVTGNRVQRGDWGSNICSVVYAPSQFSWTQNRKFRYQRPTGPEWEMSQKVARDYLRGARVHRLKKATHFWATYVMPQWAHKMVKVMKIDDHVFYEERNI